MASRKIFELFGSIVVEGLGDAKTEFTVKDKDGLDVPSSEPQLLDGVDGYPSTTSKYIDYYVNFTKEWKALNLPREY